MLLPQNSHHAHSPVFCSLANMLIMKGTRNQSKMEDLIARVRATEDYVLWQSTTVAG
jgi:hypothetical protein